MLFVGGNDDENGTRSHLPASDIVEPLDHLGRDEDCATAFRAGSANRPVGCTDGFADHLVSLFAEFQNFNG